MKISNNKVSEFLIGIESISEDQYKTIISIRTLFFKTKKTLIEDIKYGGLVFSVDEGLIGGIYVYKKHISVEFSNGADFSDPDSILEGGGKKRRHLKICSQEDIVLKKVEFFIKQAVSN